MSPTNESSSFQNPPQSPWFLEMENTPYAIQVTNFKSAVDFREILDLFNWAQYEIMREMAATDPFQNQPVGVRSWTSDNVHLSIHSNDLMLHSVCGLYLAAIVRLWGFKSGYRFYEAEFEFLETTGWPKIVGSGEIIRVGVTVEN